MDTARITRPRRTRRDESQRLCVRGRGQPDELTVDARADQVVRVLKFLKDDPRCRFGSSPTSAALTTRSADPRFDVVLSPCSA